MDVLAILRITAGVLMLAIGLVGLLMPVLPGWLFIIPGVVLLGVRRAQLHCLLNTCERKFPWCRRAVEPARSYLDRKEKSA